MTTVWLFSADGARLGEFRFEQEPETTILWRGGVYRISTSQSQYGGSRHYYRVPVTEIGEAEKV